MYLISIIILITVFVLGVCQAGETEECPKDSAEQVKQCLSETNLGITDGKPHALALDAEVTMDLCSTGKLQKAVDCMGKIYKACANDMEAMNVLSMEASVSDWKTASTKLCDNVNVIKESGGCLNKDQEATSLCVSTQKTAFEGEMNAKVLTSHNDKNALMGVACSYSTNIMKCIKEPLVKNCPDNLKSLVLDVFRLLLPPPCKPAPDSGSKDVAGYDTVSDDKTDPKNVGSSLVSFTSLTVILSSFILFKML
ncbi:hypothetical protein SNE40_015765 [Patella caerulea]|uniref:Uncharacterized protein n=1 Tax=Patella caerulea TaxID=87958 RepID=A0AAN8PVS7_PATCE